MDEIRAPWSPEQVQALNEFQQRGRFHPFTCANAHTHGSPALVAHEDGWHCPDPSCGYRQAWAHVFMTDPRTREKPFGERHGPTPEEMQPLSSAALREALVTAFAAAAYECDGKCGLEERECYEAHPIVWTATSNGVVHFDASSVSAADVAVRVCQSLDLVPPE